MCHENPRTKKEYFEYLNVKDLSANKKFWKTIKPCFSDKGLNSNNTLLKEKGELVSGEKPLASIINQFFINITKSLKLKEDQGSHPVTLNDILNSFSTRVLTRLEKLTKAIKSFLSNK